jgi:hypothetical protein
MASEPPAERQESVRAGRAGDEVVFRLPTLGRLLRTVLPEEAVEHLVAAQREQMLAARAVLDAAIERLEEAARAEPRRKPRRTEVAVE